MSSAATPLTLWLLKYDYVPDILEKRTPHRGEHIAGTFSSFTFHTHTHTHTLLQTHTHTHPGLQQAATDGTLVLGGALADPVDTGILIFTQKEIAEKFAGQDPYVKAGLVTKWSVRQWTVVAGSKL
jgi:uncharacterized protein YciI